MRRQRIRRRRKRSSELGDRERRSRELGGRETGVGGGGERGISLGRMKQ